MSHRTANVARTPSRKWELNCNWLTARKECGSILSSRLRGEALRDDTKNSCVYKETNSTPASLPRVFAESANLFGCHVGVSGHGKETKPRNRTSATSTFVLFSDASTVRCSIWYLHLQTNLLAKNTNGNPPTTKGQRYAAKRKRRTESRGGEQLLI